MASTLYPEIAEEMIELLFHTFRSHRERRCFGGSSFIEIQFCKLPPETTVKERVAVGNIKHWQDDSLYADDENAFYREYRNIFDCGTYGNLKCGTVDLYGINYYAPFLTDSILEKLRTDQPAGYERLIEWLVQSKQYNGFYILGL